MNDTGDGDTAQSEEMTVQDDTAEVYMEFMLIYINHFVNSVCIYVQCVLNEYFSKHLDRGSRNGNEARRKRWRGVPPSPHCTQMVNQSLPRVLRRQSSINADTISGRTSPLASSYGREAKPPIVMLTSSLTLNRKCYGQM